jgi:hypothetical protein
MVFRLTAPAVAGDAWVESVIHTFEKGKDGTGPHGIVLKGDRIYGTTFRTVYRLKRPASIGGAWDERVLFRFEKAAAGDGPGGAVTLWNGSVYGTTPEGGTANGGTAFQLTP